MVSTLVLPHSVLELEASARATDKEKRSKEYLGKVKKWMKDEGLSSQSW